MTHRLMSSASVTHVMRNRISNFRFSHVLPKWLFISVFVSPLVLDMTEWRSISSNDCVIILVNAFPYTHFIDCRTEQMGLIM